MIRLYNPSHDMVLAEKHRATFTPPKLIQQFEKDLALLPLWYADAGDFVFADYAKDVEFESDFERLTGVTLLDYSVGILSSKKKINVEEFAPWGLNEAVLRQYTNCSKSDIEIADEVRKLSHRRISIEFLREFLKRGLFSWKLPEEFVSIDELFNGEGSEVVVKMPWSSSGRGVVFVSRNIDKGDARYRRIEKAIEEQGSVIMEQKFDNVLDFAIEFQLVEGRYRFAGYSLFNTSKGAYMGNLLATNEEIERRLGEFVSIKKLREIVSVLEALLTDYVSPRLNLQYVGVDMMIVRVGNRFEVHPCIEVNLRMTMGMVARIFFDRFVCSDAVGEMRVERGEIEEKRELMVEDGLIRSGVMRLTAGNEFYVVVSVGN